ncbi:5886_t:CDS:2, partial [Entrophospora sp. SA101]
MALITTTEKPITILAATHGTTSPLQPINTTLKACSTVNYRPSMPLLASIYDESPAFIG